MIFENFDRDLRKLATRDQVIEQFHEKTQALFKNTTDYYKKKSAAMILEGSGWGEQVLIHEKELEQQLMNLIKNLREKELEKLMNMTQVSSFEVKFVLENVQG